MAKGVIDYIKGEKKPGDSPIEVIAQVKIRGVDGEEELHDVYLVSSESPVETINFGILSPKEYYTYSRGLAKGVANPSVGLDLGEEYVIAEMNLRSEGFGGSSTGLQKMIEEGEMGFDSLDEFVRAFIEACEGMDKAGVEGYKSPFAKAAALVLGGMGEDGVEAAVQWVERYGQDDLVKELGGKQEEVEYLAEHMKDGEPMLARLEGDDNVLVVNLETGEVTPDDEDRKEKARSLLS